MSRTLIIGSRGSKLALFQAEQAQAQLRESNPNLQIRIEIIKTTGDVKTEPLTVIGGKGVFTKELEDALLDRRIDIAVHSLKDLPTVLPHALTIGAICEREDPRDALVMGVGVQLDARGLEQLPKYAVVGTSSQRRLAQLKALQPEVVIKDLRGNVDTRLRKLDEGLYDALILASAGLIRLGLANRISAAIPTNHMLPAVGQGAVAIEVRRDDEAVLQAVSSLDHQTTRFACQSERALLRSLGGGCQLPIAGHAVIENDELSLEGLVAAPDGSKMLRERISGAAKNAEELGTHLAERLIANGANSILKTFKQ